MDGLKEVRKNWLKFHRDILPKTITKIKNRYGVIGLKSSSPGGSKMEDMHSKLKDNKTLARLIEKITTAEEALSAVRPGDHIFIGSLMKSHCCRASCASALKQTARPVWFFSPS